MALKREKKAEIVSEVRDLLKTSKMTVFAYYSGTSVKAMEQLRQAGQESDTTIRVVKNRLFKKALENTDALREINTEDVKGQLLFAFNAEDEVAPAQVIAGFAKEQPQIEFAGAITADGQLLKALDVKALAGLPSKQQLRAQLAGTMATPIGGFVNVVAANLKSVVNVLNARAEKI